MRITVVGHASLLVEAGGVGVLSDPCVRRQPRLVGTRRVLQPLLRQFASRAGDDLYDLLRWTISSEEREA